MFRAVRKSLLGERHRKQGADLIAADKAVVAYSLREFLRTHVDKYTDPHKGRFDLEDLGEELKKDARKSDGEQCYANDQPAHAALPRDKFEQALARTYGIGKGDDSDDKKLQKLPCSCLTEANAVTRTSPGRVCPNDKMRGCYVKSNAPFPPMFFCKACKEHQVGLQQAISAPGDDWTNIKSWEQYIDVVWHSCQNDPARIYEVAETCFAADFEKGETNNDGRLSKCVGKCIVTRIFACPPKRTYVMWASESTSREDDDPLLQDGFGYGKVRRYTACPTDCYRRFQDDHANAHGPISRCYHWFAWISSILGFISVVMLGITFIDSWVSFPQKIQYTDGNIYPMFLEGACICNGTLCPDVAFTFDLALDNSTVGHPSQDFWDRWFSTAWWDFGANKGGSEFATGPAFDDNLYAIPSASSLGQDVLPLVEPSTASTATLASDGLVKAARAGSFLRFSARAPRGTSAFACDTLGTAWEDGSPWKVDSANAKLCSRNVTLKVRGVQKDNSTRGAGSPHHVSIFFHSSLAVLNVRDWSQTTTTEGAEQATKLAAGPARGGVIIDEMPVGIRANTTAWFSTPSPILCGQGPHLFLAAGLRGTVEFVGEVEDFAPAEIVAAQSKATFATVPQDHCQTGEDCDEDASGSSDSFFRRQLTETTGSSASTTKKGKPVVKVTDRIRYPLNASKGWTCETWPPHKPDSAWAWCSPKMQEGCCVTDSESSDRTLRAALFDRPPSTETKLWTKGKPSITDSGKSEVIQNSRCTVSMKNRRMVLQHPISNDPKIKVHRSTENTACFLKEPTTYSKREVDVSSAYDLTLAKTRWYHLQQWQQVNEFEVSRMTWAGWLLGLLCSILAFSDFNANLMPSEFPLRKHFDFQRILRKIVCSCGLDFTKKKKELRAAAIARADRDKAELEKVKKWELDVEKTDQSAKGHLMAKSGSKLTRCKQWFYGPGFDSKLFYVLVYLPFNFCISNYTSVGHSFIENSDDREDQAGLYDITGSTALIISLPYYFMVSFFVHELCGVSMSCVVFLY